MNIFIDALPDFVAVKGKKYGILTDFRIWMEFDRIIHQDDISVKDRIMMILHLCLDRERCPVLPENVMATMNALRNFYLCGAEAKDANSGKKERALDFSEDSGYIHSAFLTQYGIDLLSVPYMHWYVFCALLEGLEASRKLIKIMGFRTCDLQSVQNAEKKKYLKRMKELYALPNGQEENLSTEDVAEVLFKAF